MAFCWKKTIFLGVIVALMNLSTPSELPAQLGGLRGIVLDADFRQPIPSVEVTLIERGESVQTDDQGTFVFNALEPATYSLRLAKQGYLAESVSNIAVSAGEVREVRVELTMDIIELDEMVVVAEDLIAEEQTDVALLDIRKDIGGLVDSIGEDFISQVGAGTAAAALERVTGTSIQDGKFVVIRGLADRYTNVTLNGSRLPSPDPDRRSVQVDVFPGKLIGSISAYKTFTPDLYADGSGGSVDIETKNYPSEPVFSASVGFSYNTNTTFNDRYASYEGGGSGVFAKDGGMRELPDLIDNASILDLPEDVSKGSEDLSLRASRMVTPYMGVERQSAPLNYSAEISVGDGFEWFGRPTGVILGLTWSRDYQYQPGRLIYEYSEPFFISGELRDRKLFVGDIGQETTLLGALLSLGHQLSDNSDLKLTLFYSRADEDSAARLKEDPRFEPTDRPGIKVRDNLVYVARNLGVAQLTGEFRIPTDDRDAVVNMSVTAARTTQDQPDSRFFDSTFIDFGSFGEFYQVDQAQGGEATRRVWQFLEETSYSMNLDVELPVFQDYNDSSSFKYGAFYEFTERSFDQRELAYTKGEGVSENVYYFGTKRFPGFRNLILIDEKSEDASLANFFFEEIEYSTDVGLRNYYLYDRTQPFGFYDARQNLGAFYGMFDVQFAEDFQVVIGARAAYTDIIVEGASEEDIPGVEELFPGGTSADIQQLDVLPAFAVTWDFFKDMKLRLAWSRTIARPSLKELSPASYPEALTSAIFLGNPSLQISSVTNYDVRWEWFPRPGEVIAISGFSKFIQDPIELTSFRVNADSPLRLRYQNFEKGYIYGLEFEVKKRLDWHSPLLKHFSVGANYGYFFSGVRLSADDRKRRIEQGFPPIRRLQGQPDYILNFNLAYDNQETGLYTGIFYNIVGPQVTSAGRAAFPDIIRKPAPSLDFVFKKKFFKNWEFTFRAKNLMDSEIKTVQTRADGQEFINDVYKTGRTYSFSLGFDW